MPFDTTPRSKTQMERVTLFLPKEVVASINALSKRLDVRPVELVRQILARECGSPASELDEALDKLKGVGAASQRPVLKVLDDKGEPIPEAMPKITMDDVKTMDSATIKALNGSMYLYDEVVSEEVSDAIFRRYEQDIAAANRE